MKATLILTVDVDNPDWDGLSHDEIFRDLSSANDECFVLKRVEIRAADQRSPTHNNAKPNPCATCAYPGTLTCSGGCIHGGPFTDNYRPRTDSAVA